MELSEETTPILYKNTIQYLHDIAQKVPNTLSVLKSYYASKFRISELQTKITLEKNKNKSDICCPKCCLKLGEIDSSYSVQPESKKSKFARKLMKRVKANKRLTKFQVDYLKKNDLKEANKLVITCNFCQKKVIRDCAKPVKPRVDAVTNERLPVIDKNKKKKKKKDKFAGLQQGAVIAVQAGLNKNGVQCVDINPNKKLPVTDKNKKKKKNKFAGLQQGAVSAVQENLNKKKNKGTISVQNSNQNGNQADAKIKVINNTISKKKDKQKKKQVIRKLNNMLNTCNLKPDSKNYLNLFLQSFAK